MLDPWSDPESPTRNRAMAPPPVPPISAVVPAAAAFESDEVVTSAPPVSARPELEPASSRGRPPPLRFDAERVAPAGPAAAVADNGVDLSEIEALSDLPDDGRAAFAAAAKVQTLGREDEVSGFALALVLEGLVDVSATIVDAAAQRMGAGAVVRARGTIEQFAPVRLIGASETSRVATWDEHAVTEAFRSCPWVEDELRATGDRLQALVGITMGPLGDRLDPGLRADLMSRLQLRIAGRARGDHDARRARRSGCSSWAVESSSSSATTACRTARCCIRGSSCFRPSRSGRPRRRAPCARPEAARSSCWPNAASRKNS